MFRVFVAFVVIISLFWSLWQPYPSNRAVIIVCDVGQGDAIILMYGTFQALIDGGPSPEAVLKCLGENLPLWDRKLDMVIATHADADHIGGLPEVLNRYQVGIVLANFSDKDSDLAKDFYLQIAHLDQTGSTKWRQSSQLEVFKLDHDFWLQILSPPEENQFIIDPKRLNPETILSAQSQVKMNQKTGAENSENNRSIAIYLQYKSFSILLTGDLECPGEIAMVKGGVTKEANILKVGHHGSKTSTCQALLEEIRPENSVISVGENNRFKHPSPEVLSNLVAIGAKIWRTDLQGRIKIVTDGHKYWIQPGSE